MKTLAVKNFKDAVNMLITDEFTTQEDKDWWEGVLYGLFLAGRISADQKEHLTTLLGYVHDENVEELNNGGEPIECIQRLEN